MTSREPRTAEGRIMARALDAMPEDQRHIAACKCLLVLHEMGHPPAKPCGPDTPLPPNVLRFPEPRK